MALAAETYREFEDIVGRENISDDPAIVEGYHNFTTGQVLGLGTVIKPVAVILPGCTEEIQAIMRTCNRHKIKYNVYCTNFGAPPVWGGITTKNMIQLDLRRMNRILEVDDKNMYAVVEPYVLAGQLNGELHKIGLTAHCTGPGPTISVLATSAAMFGIGFDSIFMGWSGRNVLGVEWVMPTGEVVRLGATGSGLGWFYPDSPGTSLWGMVRGATGTMSGLGVFTKCAVKLYPWAGQGEASGGVSPHIKVQKHPERLRCFLLTWPSMDKMAEALYMINKAQIGYALDKNPGMAAVFAVTDSNDEAWALIRSGMLDVMLAPPNVTVSFTLGAFSLKEMEYQHKVLNDIVSRTDGFFSNEYLAQFIPKVQDILYFHHAWNCGTTQGTFKPAGTFYVGVSFIDTTDVCDDGSLLFGEIKKEFEDKGVLLQEGGESNWAGYYEGGTLAGLHTETIWQGDPADLDSMLAANDLFFKGIKPWIDRGLTPFWGQKSGQAGFFGSMFGGPAGTSTEYRTRIKKTFDPKNIGNPMSYVIVPEEEE